MIPTLARYELRRLFLSPLAWTILAVVQFICGLIFVVQLGEFMARQMTGFQAMAPTAGVTETVVASLLAVAGFVLLIVTPLISMRLISEERRNKTLSLLYSAPLSMSEIVLGKFLGLLGFLLVVAALIALMPLSLLTGGTLDYGLFAAGMLGLVLLLANFAAVGVFMSSLTQHQLVAAVGALGILLGFWLLAATDDGSGGALAYLSFMTHFDPFLRGAVNSGSVAYHLIFTATFLALTVRRLDMDRLGG